MKITSISYGKTINIGNYQSVRVELSADVDEHIESYRDVLSQLRGLLQNEETQIRLENSPHR